MKSTRREILRSIGGTTVGASVLGQITELSAAETRKWQEKVQSMENSLVSEQKTDHSVDPDDGGLFGPSQPRHLFSSADIKLLEVFKTDTYGWEAYVGLTGCAQALMDQGDSDWRTVGDLTDTEYEVVNASSNYFPPIVDPGYRGFTPEGSRSNINLPDWVEPSFEVGVSTLVSLASSNPWADAGTAVALSVPGILDSLQGENGKTSINNGYRVHYSPENSLGLGTSDSEMTHYQRINGRFGEFETGPELKISSRFSTQDPPNLDVETSFDIFAFESGGGAIASQSYPENMSDINKREYGYVSVSGGNPENPVIRSNAMTQNRIQRLSETVENREVEAVMLDPPAKIE